MKFSPLALVYNLKALLTISAAFVSSHIVAQSGGLSVEHCGREPGLGLASPGALAFLMFFGVHLVAGGWHGCSPNPAEHLPCSDHVSLYIGVII